MKWKKHLGGIIIQRFWITYLCLIFFKRVFFFFLWIHSILSSSPAPKGHSLSIRKNSVHLCLWSFICHICSSDVLGTTGGPYPSPHTPRFYKDALWLAACSRDPLLREDGTRAHNHSTFLCYPNRSWFYSVCFVNILVFCLLIPDSGPGTC